MDKIIAQGKTTNEAISNGLKELKVSRDMVNVKVIDEDNKRMFYSILAPRVVKVELTLKENAKIKKYVSKPEQKLTQEQITNATDKISNFLDEFLKSVDNTITYTISSNDNFVIVDMQNGNVGNLIGYRGETLYALQDILTQIASIDQSNRVRVMLDINKYKEKREKTLEELATRIAKQVKTKKRDFKLEPMKPYERKLIHQKLQDEDHITTYSVGTEPRRCLVISYKK